MEVIPAIDLRNGKCVRLYQGDYNQETTFSEEPLAVALEWQSAGAPRIHLVDLDGAASGIPANLEIIRSIASTVLIPTEMGGGIRSLKTIEAVLTAGVERVILGTAAVEVPGLVEEACKHFGSAIAVSIDALNGKLATHGWMEETELDAAEFAHRMATQGVKRFIYTDISRDGTLTEPNFSSTLEFIEAVRQPVIAAGGVASITHLKVLNKLGAEGAIIGKALYTGAVNLKNAVRAVE